MGIIFDFFFSKIASRVIEKKAINGIEGLSDRNKDILEALDAYTAVIVSALPGKVLGATPYNDDALKTEDIDIGWKRTGEKGFTDWTKGKPEVEHNEVSRSFVIDILKEDDIFGEVNPKLGEFLRSNRFLPLSDKVEYLPNDDAAKALLTDLKLMPGQANPIPYHTWTEMSSDEAMSRIFFYGIGSVLMLNQSSRENKWPDLGPYVVDLDISSLPIRKGFCPYGFRIHFDVNQKVTAIYDYPNDELVKPNDGKKWDRAKHLVKQTTFTVITAREHLQWTHLIGSNAAARASQVHCPPSHPIRRLLTVFTFNTNYINNNAEETLIPRLSMVHRATAFKIKGIIQVFEDGYSQSNIFEPFPSQKIGTDLKKLADDGCFPFYTEGIAYFDIVRTFVKEWLDEAGDEARSDKYARAFYAELVRTSKGQAYELPTEFSDEALIDIISQLIFIVTAYHEIVGTVVDYTQLPSFMGFRIASGNNKKDTTTLTTTDTQSFLIASALTASTALRMPELVGKFDNFMSVGGAPEWESRVWSNFQDAIRKQSVAVQEADEERVKSGKPEFKSMDPARFECAVSV